MRYRVSADALERVGNRFGQEAKNSLKTKRFPSWTSIDTASRWLGIDAPDLILEFDPDGWNPFPTVRPSVTPDFDHTYIVEDKDGRIFVAQWVNCDWDIVYDIGEKPAVVAFRYAPPRFKPDPEIDMHPDAVYARTRRAHL